MLKHIKIQNVGPASKMELEFGKRLNILTGDNGLGKSFLLDICWWALTRKWPAEVNEKLSAGLMARPYQPAKAEIEFALTTKIKSVTFSSTFDRASQAWTSRHGRPYSAGLIIYALADGGFAVWDPARNYWRKKGNIDIQDRPPAYVFSQPEIWKPLYEGEDSDYIPLCNGLILDWGGWQKEKGEAFATLSAVLEALSPSESEKIEAGELTRISLDDPRDIPTLRMSYGQDVPVLHASAGVRRIIALAYLLVWTWEEHLKACKLLGVKPASEVIFLIDEIEAHLHPQWQRRIIGALLAAVNKLASKAKVQVIAATHSPLILASLEPIFDPEQDAWFDLDLERENHHSRVTLTRREFELHGDVCNWLTSEAFDLPSARSLEAEKLLDEAARLLEKDQIKPAEVRKMYDRLVNQLSPLDSFLFRWRAIVEKKGWLK